ncbi:serine hydrolase [Cupriavidus pauculus]|uniref:serine hydrolase n=1 Tax=Cupriavidus pauculus TaxID=82633 RepID=UPI0030F54D95
MLEDFDGLVEAAMAEWQVPGLALAVIKDQETILMKGYGVRDVESRLPVTPNTQFLLCSITKSFTAAGLGLLVDEDKLDWTRPVREYLPEFRLYDAVATERVTVRDLLCHHSGLPRHDWIHSPGDLSTAQLLAALRHLEPSHDLRDTYQYQNLAYVVAGHIAERITGKCWSAFLTERLLQPLGFQNFSLSIEALSETIDHAHPHIEELDQIQRASLTPIRALPAGGLNAAVSDVAKWMRFLMNDGAVNGKQLLSTDIVRQMSTPRVHAGRSAFGEIGEIHYGLGLSIEHYRGEQKVSHSGSWVGWGTLMTMLPERSIAVAVLTNHAPSAVTELLTYSALDRLCGREPIDWLGHFGEMRRKIVSQRSIDSTARCNSHRTETKPSHALHEYAGSYEHPAYGCMIITHEGDTLLWQWRGMSGPLQHRHYDVFMTARKPAEIHPDELPLTFGYNREGVIDKVAAPMEPMVADIVFSRVPSGDVMDVQFRAHCAGTYSHGSQEIQVRLDAAGSLTLQIAKQQIHRLIPLDGRTFELGKLQGYRVEFRRPSEDLVDGIIFHQPNGTFLARRGA